MVTRKKVKSYKPEYRMDEHGEFYNIKIPYKEGFVEVQIDIDKCEEFEKYNWSVLTVRGVPKYLSRYCYTDEKSKKQRQQLHQFIMDVDTSYFMHIDHIDGNGMNCRGYNMRLATRKENSRNTIKKMKGTSTFKGVCWNKRNQRWLAQIRIDGKGEHLGSFVKEIINEIDEGEIRAAREYDKAAVKYFGSFASLNFPEERNMVTSIKGKNYRVSFLFNESEVKKIETKVMELQRFKPKEIIEIMQVMPLPEIVRICHYFGCGIEEVVREIKHGVKVSVAL